MQRLYLQHRPSQALLYVEHHKLFGISRGVVVVILGKVLRVSNMKKWHVLQGVNPETAKGLLWCITFGVCFFVCCLCCFFFI